ncbi:hypothetical protein [Niallia taxi]|uniref:hypothetical protein n=1 Tax=Niallia taxi TaxID=2499688 RepID=UPI003008D974
MKLYTYQEDLMNNKADKIVINWCRGAGKDYAIARYILDKGINTVGIFGRFDFRSLINAFEGLKEQYNFTIELTIENKLNRISVKESNRAIDLFLLENKDKDLMYYDLIVGHTYGKIECKKHIVALTVNNHESSYKISTLELEDYNTHTVDYRVAMQEGVIKAEQLIHSALNNQKDFYREYALNDKYIEEKMEFREFTSAALLRLQKQFLSTSDTKDTVLTRKNIIEMIKDIKEMSLHKTI